MDSKKGKVMFFVSLVFAIVVCTAIWLKVTPSAQMIVNQGIAHANSDCAKHAHSKACDYKKAARTL